LGVAPVGAMKHPEVHDAIVSVHRCASDAGLVTGIHASEGKTGHAMAQLGFQMITLAAESQALRRGAAEHLREATAQ
jgi:4-hydroxy-2-oxoheptanedioate aldolase